MNPPYCSILFQSQLDRDFGPSAHGDTTAAMLLRRIMNERKKKLFYFWRTLKKKSFRFLVSPLLCSVFFCRQLQYMHRKKTFFLHCTWQWTRCESLSTPLKVIQLRTRATYTYRAYQKVHYQEGQPRVMDQDSGLCFFCFGCEFKSPLLWFDLLKVS